VHSGEGSGFSEKKLTDIMSVNAQPDVATPGAKVGEAV
jgi:hypothetical protein